ncbi:MAG: hypothetical protein C4536_02260 [Actinobacteria bacterium]|jgi:hypothetical protein|nr:MAG: hypothetical protein C4536_02260 [Actinomycetota bacterium]
MSGGIIHAKWFRWTLAAVIVLALMALSAVVWNAWGKPEVNTEAIRKAQKLYDLAVEYGMDVPEDEAKTVDLWAEIYGSDGGYGVEVAEGSLRSAALYFEFSQTGVVNQRPHIIDPDFLEFQVLVLKVYRPDLYEEVLRYVGSRDYYENKLPQWMLDDYNALPE